MKTLVVKAQRQGLDQLGASVGSPVLYLKAAWADPVLYGGRGERIGSDLDVLVREDAFPSFAEALERQGYRRHRFPTRAHERYFGAKEWTFFAPTGAALLTVDLHRALVNPVWYEIDTAATIARAVAYESAHGPILSLAPEDQIVYAAAQCAAKCYDVDERHLRDMAALAQHQAIEWSAVRERCERAGLTVAWSLFLEGLRDRGVEVPVSADPARRGTRARRALLRAALVPAPGVSRRKTVPRALDYLVWRPLLSDRVTALPRVAWRYGVPIAVERIGQKLSAFVRRDRAR